jgi:6-phosphogluconolactonase
MHEFRIFASRKVASIALAQYVGDVLAGAIAERGDAACVLSGGSSPVDTYRALRQYPLPWEKVLLVPGDERLVAIDNANSNEGMLRRELIQEAASAAKVLSLAITGAPDNTQIARINSQLGKLNRPLDIVVLGMGDDGHTASLFPDSPNIADAMSSDDYCVVQHPAGSALARLTLTPALLLDSRIIVLLFFGEDKRTVYERAIAGNDLLELPVRFVLQQNVTPVLTFWAS